MDMVHAREWGCLICAGIKRTGAPKLVAFRMIGAEYHPKTGALSHLHTLRKAMEHRPLPADTLPRAANAKLRAAKTTPTAVEKTVCVTPREPQSEQAMTNPTEMQSHAVQNLEELMGLDYLVSPTESIRGGPSIAQR